MKTLGYYVRSLVNNSIHGSVWDSVDRFVMDSVRVSVMYSVQNSIDGSIYITVGNDPVRTNIWIFAKDKLKKKTI